MSFKIGLVTKSWAESSQIPVWYESVTTSTNSIAKDHEIAEDPITLYLADHQTAGRGRGDHTWSDPQEGGDALLSSWVFKMRKAPQPVLSPAIGLAVWTAFQASFPWLPLSLKAPNDLYLGHKKLAGLLIENVQQGSHHRLVVGLGVNILKAPSDVETSTCLAELMKTELNSESWINVLDRLLLEISLAVSQTKETLSAGQQQALLHALNRFPLLENPFEKIEKDGSLWKKEQKINWSEL
jgi:BirA family biotin operon repressor/biotin-[acetyl-CoA-carboxylase] ligase